MPTSIQERTPLGDILAEWRITEYSQHERNHAWYIIMGFLGFLFVLYGIFSGNFLFSLIIILAGIILFLQSKQTPLVVTVAICTNGFIIGNRLYPFSELEKFYIIYRPEEDLKTLFFDTKSPFRPMLRIPLEDQNPIEIREHLKGFLVEDVEKEDEPAGDTVARKWQIH